MALPTTTAPVHAPGPAPGSPARIASSPAPGGGGFSFADLLDAVNPLQHIPVVSTLYRAVTGDEIKAPARLLGAGLFGFGLFGGLAGLAGAAANSLLAGATGKDAGAHVLALLRGGDHTAAPPFLPTVTASERAGTEQRGAEEREVMRPLLDRAAHRALAQSFGGERPLLALEPPARAPDRQGAGAPPSATLPIGAVPAQAGRAYGQALATMQAALERDERAGGQVPHQRG